MELIDIYREDLSYIESTRRGWIQSKASYLQGCGRPFNKVCQVPFSNSFKTFVDLKRNRATIIAVVVAADGSIVLRCFLYL